MIDDLKDDIAGDLEYWEDQLKSCLRDICDDCDPLMDYVPLEYHGAPCTMEQAICEPGEDHCKKVEEYEEICRLLDEVYATRKRIEGRKMGHLKLPQLALPFEVVA